MTPLWMLLAKDTRNREGFPLEWPVEYSHTEKPAPWKATTIEGFRDQQALHEAEYDQWKADRAPPPFVEVVKVNLQSPNGSVFELVVNDAGKVTARPA